MRPDFNRPIFKPYLYNIIKNEGEQIKSIYETKSYKLILSYYTNTKLHKNSVFSKMITFNIVEFNGMKCDYYITISISYNKINNTIKTVYIGPKDTIKEVGPIISKIKCDTVFNENIYSILFNNINNNDYVVAIRS